MKQFYIYVDNQQVGPLTFEQLKIKKLSRECLVWHNGLSEWQKAETLNELQELFKSIPPPLPNQNFIIPPTLPLVDKTNSTNQYTQPEYQNEKIKIIGIKRNFFLYGMIAVIIIIGATAFTNYQSEQNVKNYQLEIRLAEQERIARENKIKELTIQLQTAYDKLEIAKRELNDASAFKLLRSAEARHEQVSAAEDQVKVWEDNIEELQIEIEKLNSQQSVGL